MSLKRAMIPYAQTLFRKADKSQMDWGKADLKRMLHSDVPIIGEDPKFGLIGPRCCLCNKVVDKEEQVDEYRGPQGGYIDVRVHCHGSEDVARFDYASREFDHHDVRRSMDSHRWFDPTVQGEANVVSVPDAVKG